MAYAHGKIYSGETSVSNAAALPGNGRSSSGPLRHEDWNALREELENLLDQVSTQQGRHRSGTAPARPFASTGAGGPPSQPSGPLPPPNRRQEALQSVQRALDHLNEPDEGAPMPAYSPNNLQSAIEQIRQRQNRADRPGADTGQNAPANRERLDGLNETLAGLNRRFARVEQAMGTQQNSARAIEDMATQIEQLASVVELLANSVGESAHIKRLENQIAKLANAVHSEPGLEFGAISQRLDVLSGAFEQLTRLQARQADHFEAREANHLEEAASGQHMQAIESGVRNICERLDTMEEAPTDIPVGIPVDLAPIEACVRSIYDRMDVLETGLNATTPAMEQLSRDMAEFTKAMQDENVLSPSASLVGRVDALNQRIAQIEESGEEVGDLRLDIQNLHTSVVAAVEPRFSALENQIDALSASPHAMAGESELSVERLEEQIAALGEKMDRTGNELNDLQRFYSQSNAPENSPDFSVIADMVAQRTSKAIENAGSRSEGGLDRQALDELEKRLSSLFENQKSAHQGPAFSKVQSSIDQVNQRLARLEETLAGQSPPGPEREEEVVPAGGKLAANPMLSDSALPFVSGATEAIEDYGPAGDTLPAERLRHPGLVDRQEREEREEREEEENAAAAFNHDQQPGDDVYFSEESFQERSANAPSVERPERLARHLIPALQDTMPRSPAAEAPLNAPAFPPPLPDENAVPVPEPLRPDPSEIMVMDNAQSDFSGIAREGSDPVAPRPTASKPIKLPRFAAGDAVPPPAPTSPFAPGAGGSAASSLSSVSSAAGIGASGSTTGTQPGTKSRNTDAKVSRSTFIEAARRAAKKHNPPEPESGSQSLIGKALARFRKNKGAKKTPDSVSEPVMSPPAPAEPAPAPNNAGDAVNGTEQLDVVEVPDSFLTRHRQPILLVATLLAVSLLTMNLLNQRFNPPAATPDAIDSGASVAASLGDGPAGAPSDPAPDNAEPANPASDSGAGAGDIVGAIGTQVPAANPAVRMIDPAPMSQMPATLDLASTTVGQLTPQSVSMALPPEGVGPLALRQAAANGDARAQFEVAAILAEGRAVAQDLEAAAIWYERAAGGGLAPAAYRIGNMYENGVGVAGDLETARQWYQMGADAGNRMSMHNLASLLASGGLGDQQFEAAAQWFERAAALGLTDSQFNLGMLYARGLGVPQDLGESFRWFSIAAAGGDEDAIRARDDVLRSLDGQTLTRLQGEIAGWRQMEMNIPANFAPIGSWSDSFDPGPLIDNKDIVTRVQRALNKLGFDAGIPDGIFGPQTAAAVSAFERATGMSESGKINPRLLSVLGSQPV